jgi:hypothetical protein
LNNSRCKATTVNRGLLPSAVALPCQKFGSSLRLFLWTGRDKPLPFADHQPPSPSDKADWTMSPGCCSFSAGSPKEFVEKTCSEPRSEMYLASCTQTSVQVLIDGEMTGQDAANVLHRINEFRFFFKTGQSQAKKALTCESQRGGSDTPGRFLRTSEISIFLTIRRQGSCHGVDARQTILDKRLSNVQRRPSGCSQRTAGDRIQTKIRRTEHDSCFTGAGVG